jgi:oligoribonuclease NrnB/cAMP/cGMP phosphodiesterase (DHH superfamily)
MDTTLEIKKVDTVVLYHANCYDGFGAAYAAWKYLGDSATYIPMTYGEALPECVWTASQVYMLDYSRKTDELIKLSYSTLVIVLDHHKTALAELEKAGAAIEYVFDIEQSGAVLAWQYFHKSVPVPRILNAIQDRDLWRFKLRETPQIHAALCGTEFSFAVWDYLITRYDQSERFQDEFYQQGETILQYHDILTETLCKEATLTVLAGHTVPMVNISILFSEVPHRLLELYPDSPFAMYVYYRKDGIAQYGLRGRDTDDFDVSEVAKLFGGGGHKKAAGYEIDLMKEEEVITYEALLDMVLKG